MWPARPVRRGPLPRRRPAAPRVQGQSRLLGGRDLHQRRVPDGGRQQPRLLHGRRRPRRALIALSLYEHEIFAAAAARLIAGDATDWPSPDELDVAGKLDGLIARLHPRATRDFRRVLHVFESALTGLVATGSARTFTTSSPAEQDDRLQAWRHSRVALFRSGYQAMKR